MLPEVKGKKCASGTACFQMKEEMYIPLCMIPSDATVIFGRVFSPLFDCDSLKAKTLSLFIYP